MVQLVFMEHPATQELMPLEDWRFHFGFVIPNSHNSWQSTTVAAGEGNMVDPGMARCLHGILSCTCYCMLCKLQLTSAFLLYPLLSAFMPGEDFPPPLSLPPLSLPGSLPTAGSPLRSTCVPL
mmetsp:Transcript_25978/g.72754  ORF Transcript_25978/g.72754 Transcript_25978/m.72754 type:complete len:123 (+) Transcript_25978:694-1062(+)